MGEENKLESLDWLKLKSDIGSVEFKRESGWEKFTRKFKENPLVPIGATATLACLLIGLDSFRKGESKKSQIMMRGRVLAQGFTVASFALGILYTSMKKNLEAQPKPTPQPDN